MIKGTDLAYCNPNVNYDAMRAAGVRFAILKLGQGKLPKDIMFNTHRAGCERVGVPWDFYWFCDYRITAAENVKNLIAKANGVYGMGHVCQDLEFRSIWGYPPGYRMRSWCLGFFTVLENDTGIIGTLYTNRDLLNQMWNGASDVDKEQLARHELWFATDDATPAPTHLPIKINQYELDTPVAWCEQRVDLNDYMEDEVSFQAWTEGASPPPQTLEQRVVALENWIRLHG